MDPSQGGDTDLTRRVGRYRPDPSTVPSNRDRKGVGSVVSGP